jgi:hypothetical protein
MLLGLRQTIGAGLHSPYKATEALPPLCLGKEGSHSRRLQVAAAIALLNCVHCPVLLLPARLRCACCAQLWGGVIVLQGDPLPGACAAWVLYYNDTTFGLSWS